MTYRCFKLPVALGAAILVGCATSVPSPVAPPASPAPAPLVSAPPAVPPAPTQPIEPAAGNTGVPAGDPTQTPLATDGPWTQRGLASWYGKKHNGRRTASGERFRAGDFTAAHRTLPIPSYVRVRRVATGEEVVVRINDRGPFHPGRVLDLSYAAANKLGIVALGNAEVEIALSTEEEWGLLAKGATRRTVR